MDSSQSSSHSTEDHSIDSADYDAQAVEDEWTILSNDDSSEDTAVGQCAPDSQKNEGQQKIQIFVTDNEGNEIKDVEDEVQVVPDTEREVPKIEIDEGQEDQVVDSGENNDNKSSDIDIIDESEDETSTASLCSSSVLSQMSNLSFLQDPLLRARFLNPDYIQEDLSDSSSLIYRDELREDVELKPGVRAYVHTPNSKLNVRLNIMLALAVTAVVGLGIGNFLGWSTLKTQQRQLSLGQVMKLKQLQDELVVCMQNQAKVSNQAQKLEKNVCYGNSDYWKERFEKLFSENKGLMELLQKTQKHYHLKGNHENILTDKECDTANASEEFHKLKLDLLIKQMEHLQLLKTLEEITFKGQQSEKRLHVLEKENNQLKKKLVEEEEDDQVIVKTWETKVNELKKENDDLRFLLDNDDQEDLALVNELHNRMAQLQLENKELQSALNLLEAQIEMVSSEPRKGKVQEYSYPHDKKTDVDNIPAKVDMLRQRINQLVAENDDLKSTIARLRWSSQMQEVVVEEEEEEEVEPNSVDIGTLEEQLNQLRDLLEIEQNESKKWKQMYEEMKSKTSNREQKPTDNPDGIFSEWIVNFTDMLKDGIFSGSTAFGQRLKTVLETVAHGSTILSEEIYNGLNATQEVIANLNDHLQNKWEQLQYITEKTAESDKKVTSKMAKLLETTLQKLQEASQKFSETNKPFTTRVKQFSSKVNKLVENLNQKWITLFKKWTRKASRNQQTGEEKIESNWIFERANSRRKRSEEQHPNDNWLLERAKDRESQRVDSDADKAENWFLEKEKKTRSKFNEYSARRKVRTEKTLEQDEDISDGDQYFEAHSYSRRR